MSERRLFLIRHGKSDFSSVDFRRSPRGRQWDPPLGEDGRRQAELLTSRLLALDDHPAAVHSSPFRRCRETIDPYSRATGIGVELEEEIGEVFTGEWEGKSFEEIVSADEELARRFREQEAMFSMSPGGESGPELRKRVEAAVGGILERHPEGDLVVVTHGGVINAFLGVILGIHDQDMFFLPDNTSVNTVVVDGSERRIRFMNDVRHLTDPGAFK